jgi:general secretion pathway protein M
MNDLQRLFESMRAWFATLSARDQRIVHVGSIVLGVMLVLGLILRLNTAHTHLQAHVTQTRADIAYIEANLTELRSAPQPQASGTALVTIIDRSTRDGGLAGNLRGTEPAGAGGTRVRIEDATYELVITWILRLEREYGLRIQSATLEKTEVPGHINASVTLVTG